MSDATPPVVSSPDGMEKRFALERERSDRLVRIITPFISVAIALLIGSLFILASGHSPVELPSQRCGKGRSGVRGR